MNVAIKVENLGKRYILRHQQKKKYLALREEIAEKCRAIFKAKGQQDSAAREEFWALRDINLEVKPGERLGIIGRNGVGKTTLLKILSRITDPTKGRIAIRGRVSSLLEVGTGFHPELTGRENIFLSGAVLGMGRRELKGKFDEIVAFAEIEKFLDTPVKRYSSGMYVRLAFSVAAHLDPDILLVDEVLAVGDMQFQQKCLGKMEDVSRKEGRTILFVSHNMGAISRVCNRVMLLDKGAKITEGEPENVLKTYLELIGKSDFQNELPVNPSLPCSIVKLKLYNGKGQETSLFDISDEVVISVTYKLTSRTNGLGVMITLLRDMTPIFHTRDVDDSVELVSREPGLYEARHTIPKMFLKAGIYSVNIYALSPTDKNFQSHPSALGFVVEEFSVNTHIKGYKRERPGHVISPGVWRTTRLG